jgi:hypothetical protein
MNRYTKPSRGQLGRTILTPSDFCESINEVYRARENRQSAEIAEPIAEAVIRLRDSRGERKVKSPN